MELYYASVVPVPPSCQGDVKATVCRGSDQLLRQAKGFCNEAHISKTKAPAKTAVRKTAFRRKMVLLRSQPKVWVVMGECLLVDSSSDLSLVSVHCMLDSTELK